MFNYSNIKFLNVKIFLALYFFLVSLGGLQRIFGDPFGLGLSSFLAFFIIISQVREIINAFKSNIFLQLWGGLIAYLLVINLINYENIYILEVNLRRILGLIICALLCAVASQNSWSLHDIKNMGVGLVLGLIISAIISDLDILDLLNNRYVNYSYINDPPTKEPVAQFGHRSIMSLYIGVMLCFLLLISNNISDRFFSIFVLFISSNYIYFLITSKNRSGLLAILITMFSYNVFNYFCKRKKNLIQSLTILSSALIIGFYFAFQFDPSNTKIFFILLLKSPLFNPVVNSILGFFNISNILGLGNISELLNPTQSALLNNSDMLRINIASDVYSNIFRNVFGRGFMANTHINFITDLVYSAGLIGVIWLAAYFYFICRLILSILKLRNENLKILSILLFSLVSWFFVGLMYNAINLGFSWVILGMLFSFKNKLT